MLQNGGCPCHREGKVKPTVQRGDITNFSPSQRGEKTLAHALEGVSEFRVGLQG